MAAPLIGTKEPESLKDPIRVLFCFVCGTIEELPPYDGPAELDTLLQISLEPHVFPSGEEHKGRLIVVEARAWMDYDTRKGIIDQIKGGGSKGLAEIDDKFYESRSTFMEEAMKCYKAHNKPKDGCGDWQRSDKVLVPQTHKERKELGMERPEKAPGPKNYLCDFCPVAIGVAQRKRKLLGLA